MISYAFKWILPWTEKPILFQPELAKAILEGRKTQTRRVIDRLLGFGPITEFDASPTTGYCCDFRDKRMLWNSLTAKELLAACPYGQVGGGLWVRERWMPVCRVGPPIYDGILYGDGEMREVRHETSVWKMDRVGKWRPSIHMPRWVSRLSLVIKVVKVERLQDISEEDAIAEGIEPLQGGARVAFKNLWESINTKPGRRWEDDPFVWALEFEVNEVVRSD